MDETLTIGKLAKAADVGVETVRYYQRRGLLETPSGRSGYRAYRPAHVERLKFIKRAQSVGFTLNEIVELMSLDDHTDHRVARKLAQEKIRDIETRVAQLEKMAEALRHLVCECEKGRGALPCPIIRMSLEE